MKAQAIRRLLACVALGGALGAGLVTATPARADADGFLNDLYDAGWYSRGGDARLLTNGYQVCRMLNSTTGDVVASYVYANTGASVTRDDAAEFVLLAVLDLCPWHDHRSQGTV